MIIVNSNRWQVLYESLIHEGLRYHEKLYLHYCVINAIHENHRSVFLNCQKPNDVHVSGTFLNTNCIAMPASFLIVKVSATLF